MILLFAGFLAKEAFDDALVFFHTPSDVLSTRVNAERKMRLGGLVKKGSLKRDGLDAEFAIEDAKDSITVKYSGSLPDLFREGQGVVAEGYYDSNSQIFNAEVVLAKHDENYMPKEVADELKKQGLWRDDS